MATAASLEPRATSWTTAHRKISQQPAWEKTTGTGTWNLPRLSGSLPIECLGLPFCFHMFSGRIQFILTVARGQRIGWLMGELMGWWNDAESPSHTGLMQQLSPSAGLVGRRKGRRKGRQPLGLSRATIRSLQWFFPNMCGAALGTKPQQPGSKASCGNHPPSPWTVYGPATVVNFT